MARALATLTLKPHNLRHLPGVGVAKTRYKTGPFLVDPNTVEVSRDGIPLKLRPQAFQVLRILMEHQGELVTRDFLVKEIWGADTFVDFDQGLNFCIREVRKVLGDDADNPKYLRTLSRRGYQFIGPVETLSETPTVTAPQPEASTATAASPQVSPATAGPARENPAPVRSRSRLYLWGAAAVICAVLVSGAFYLVSRNRPKQPVRLVVLPFENLTGDQHQEYLVRGVVEEITAQLGSMAPVSIAVVGRTSAEAVASHGWRIDEIAKQLDVDYVVEGSVRREGNLLRITAQLIRASDMAHVWAQSYDRDAMKLFTVEEQVASNIVHEINLALGRNSPSTVAHQAAISPEAMDAYLRGRDQMNAFLATIQGRLYDPAYADAYANAEREFRHAIELDPDFSLPYAGLANLAAIRVRGGFEPDPDWDSARKLAARSLQLDPNSVEARLVLSYVALLGDGTVAESEKYLKEILEQNPSEIRALTMLLQCHFLRGQAALAIAEAEQAKRLDPMNSSVDQLLATAYYRNHEYARALDIFKQLSKKRPDSQANQMYLLHAYYMAGNTAGWMETYLDRLALNARLTPTKENAQVLRRATDIYKVKGTQGFLSYLKAEGHDHFVNDGDRNPCFRYIMLGENREAMDILAKWAADPRNFRSLRLAVNDPMLDVLRGDPRYQEIINKLVPER